MLGISTITRTAVLLVLSLAWASVEAANVLDVDIDFRRVDTADEKLTVCPISATPKVTGKSDDDVCRGPSGLYEFDLACAPVSTTGSGHTITFKGTGRNVPFEIRDKNLLPPSFMSCEAGQGRRVVCTLQTAPGAQVFEYTVVTTGQVDDEGNSIDCALDPRIIVTDAGTPLGKDSAEEADDEDG